VHAQESPVGVELVLEHGNFCLRVGLPFWPLIHKMATLLFYHYYSIKDQEDGLQMSLWWRERENPKRPKCLKDPKRLFGAKEDTVVQHVNNE
jgi:hypothetical protein